PLQLYGGEAQGVGPEGGAGGEDPQALVATQPGRPHRGGPALPHRLGELPDEPDVGELLQSPDGLRVPEFRFKDDTSPQTLHQAALPGDAELFGEVAVDAGD